VRLKGDELAAAPEINPVSDWPARKADENMSINHAILFIL
jgi:hypothetical protein